MAEFVAAMLVVIFTCGLVGCVSDKNFLADEAAAYTYHLDRYQSQCVRVKGPADCAAFQADLKKLEDVDPADKTKRVGLLPTADRVIHIGKMPPEEKRAIKAAMKKVRQHP